MGDILKLAQEYEHQAWKVVRETEIVEIWKSCGASEVNLIGSLKNGLLIKHRDIDFHIYSKEFRLSDSFAAMAKLAENPRIKNITYINLLDTSEVCLEWHAWYEDDEKNLWQLDMIHLRSDSPYAGHFEKIASEIGALLTPETRERILTIKNSVPEGQKVMGIEIYKAVLQNNIRDYESFLSWRSKQNFTGIVAW